MGVASFANGRTLSKHPRLAQAVPAVVGLERARSAWVSSGRSQFRQGNENDKRINHRQILQSAPVSGERQHWKTVSEHDPRPTVKFESQVPTLGKAEKAKMTLLNKDKIINSQDYDITDTFYGESTMSGAKPLKQAHMRQSVMALKGLRKSVDYWKCYVCGGDRRPSLEFIDEERSNNCKNNFYDTSIALKGLHRAKSILDRLLYKDMFNYDDSVSKIAPISSGKPSKKNERCVCSPTWPENKETSTESKPNQSEHQFPKQTQRKTPNKKTPGSSKPKLKNKEPQIRVSPNPKTKAISRKKGVVGRPKGLFEIHDDMPVNNIIGAKRPSATKHELNGAHGGVNSQETNSSIAIRPSFTDYIDSQDQKQSEKIVKSRSLRPLHRDQFVIQPEHGKGENTTVVEDFNCSIKESFTGTGSKTSRKATGDSQELDSTTNGLSRKDNTGHSCSNLIDDALKCIDQRSGTVHSSTNPPREDEGVPSSLKITPAEEKSRFETKNSGLEESLELRDKFDANTFGKPRSRHLSTIKRRKFSFMSTAVSAFVKKPSADDLRKTACNSRMRSYSVTSQASLDSLATSVDGSDSQTGTKGSKWQLENIICASNLARYAGRATRNENGEINYTRPWRQKKKKVSKMEVNVFYAIARFMLKKQKELRSEKESSKNVSEEKAVSVGLCEKISVEESDMAQQITEESCTNLKEDKSLAMKSTKDESLIKAKDLENIPCSLPSSNGLSANVSSQVSENKSMSPSVKGDTFQPQRIARKSDRASISASNSIKRGSIYKTKSNGRICSAVTSSSDQLDIPNLSSIIGPSKAPINLTNGVLDYDDDLSTITSGVMLIPGRKQVRYKGILLRNYVSPQDRYKIEPRMRYKKSSIRWNSKEGAIVMAHSNTGSESASKTVNVVFPKQARKKALAKMVDDNHSQPVDNSARVANAELRAKIDQFLLSVEPYCRAREKTALF